MSLQANPLLYLNMGGEMIYVLRQRLKAQKIAIDKSVQVLDEVSASLLNPQTVSRLFQQSAPINLSAIRSSLERSVVSSIMRLDEMSMNKLFDLMIMMVKYQIEMATGPRELLLITLNHIDFMRDVIIDSSAGHHSLVHRMLLQVYGNLTYEEMWQARQTCLIKLDSYNVRVSILLRLALQREDGSFVPPKSRAYNERYEERRDDFRNLKLLDNISQGCNVGSLELVGDRVTFLGSNVYSPLYGINSERKFNTSKNSGVNLSNEASRSELGMLAVQLGSSEDASYSASSSQTQSRPFTLQLFSENEIIQTGELINEQDTTKNVSYNAALSVNFKDDGKEDEQEARAAKPTSNYRYKAQLNNIYTDLTVQEESETSVLRRMELLELME